MLSLLFLAPVVLAQNQQPLYSTYSFDPLKHLAGIAPYFQPSDPPRSPDPPQGCDVTRASYLVRHAAINANSFDYETYLEPFVQKLENTTADWSKIPALSFLQRWSPPKIEEESRLTRTGRLESAQLAVQLSYRYPHLRQPKQVWTSSAERTVSSAEGFIRGFEMEDNEIELVSIYEGSKAGADTLAPHKSCPKYSGATGSEQSGEYIQKFTAPIIARLRHEAPGFQWNSTDVYGMFQWCGYETVIRGSSPFCSLDLFSADEWLAFEYSQDIQYHLNVGYGNEAAGAIGFPWVNSTMNLMSADKSDEDLYVSFAHRELPAQILVALGLKNNSELIGTDDVNATMPLDRINYARQWRSSYILPFLTNIAIEQMNCSASYGYENATDPTFYRVLLNNGPQTLPGCYDGPLDSCSATGMQQLVQQRAEIVGGFSEKCDVTYDNSTDVLGIYSKNLTGQTVGKR